MSNDTRCQDTHELDEDAEPEGPDINMVYGIIMGVVGSMLCIWSSTKMAFFFRGHKILDELRGPGMGCANAVILDRKHVHIPGSGAEGDNDRDLYFVDYLFQGERSRPVALGCSRFFRVTVHQFGVNERTYVTLSETGPIPATPMLTFPRAIEV